MSEHDLIARRALLHDLIEQLQYTGDHINFGQIVKVDSRTYHISIVEQED